MSVIQVVLAMPEQILGVVGNITGKFDPKEPQFKMSSRELEVQREVNVGFVGKVENAKAVVKDVKENVLPDMKEGNVAGTLSKVVGNADMLHKINTIQPNCLSPLMKHVFSAEPIQTGLTELADKLPVVSGPALDLKNCLWATPVDFREGVFAIDGIKSSLESCKEAVGFITQGKAKEAVGKILGTPALVLGVEKASPGAMLPAIKQLLHNPVVEEAAKHYKHHFLDPLLAVRLDDLTGSPLETLEDLDHVCHTMRNLHRYVPKKAVAHFGFKFPDSLIEKLDSSIALSILERIELPAPVGEPFKAALRAAASKSGKSGSVQAVTGRHFGNVPYFSIRQMSPAPYASLPPMPVSQTVTRVVPQPLRTSIQTRQVAPAPTVTATMTVLPQQYVTMRQTLQPPRQTIQTPTYTPMHQLSPRQFNAPAAATRPVDTLRPRYPAPSPFSHGPGGIFSNLAPIYPPSQREQSSAGRPAEDIAEAPRLINPTPVDPFSGMPRPQDLNANPYQHAATGAMSGTRDLGPGAFANAPQGQGAFGNAPQGQFVQGGAPGVQNRGLGMPSGVQNRDLQLGMPGVQKRELGAFGGGMGGLGGAARDLGPVGAQGLDAKAAAGDGMQLPDMSEIMMGLFKKMDPSALLGLVEEFSESMPETFQTLLGPAMELLEAKARRKQGQAENAARAKANKAQAQANKAQAQVSNVQATVAAANFGNSDEYHIQGADDGDPEEGQDAGTEGADPHIRKNKDQLPFPGVDVDATPEKEPTGFCSKIPPEAWLGVLIALCGIATLVLMAAMNYSDDCGCTCAAA